jgi:hypothetical protein
MPAEYKKDMPEWVHQERETDLAWVRGNSGLFFFLATTSFDEYGRGALVVDTTGQTSEQSYPSGYVTQELLAKLNDDDINRMVGEYEPDHEFVIVLWKTGERTSTYRVRPLERLD